MLVFEGYFRLGSALEAAGRMADAYVAFEAGLLQNPSSTDLKRCVKASQKHALKAKVQGSHLKHDYQNAENTRTEQDAARSMSEDGMAMAAHLRKMAHLTSLERDLDYWPRLLAGSAYAEAIHTACAEVAAESRGTPARLLHVGTGQWHANPGRALHDANTHHVAQHDTNTYHVAQP